MNAATDALLIACPHCHKLNRLPAPRLADRPACGQCKQALFAGAPFALTAANFDVHAGRSQLPLLVDFWAPWCGPCLQMAPAYAAAARELEPRVHAAKVDTEAEQGLGARFNIRSIPTLALFVGGREIARQSGAMPAAQITRWVHSQLPA